MSHLIRADLRRILRRKSIWIGLALLLILLIGNLFSAFSEEDFGAAGLMLGMQKTFAGLPARLCVAGVIFFAVFADELSSKSMQCVLGRGLTRSKLIVAKLLDTLILLAAAFLLVTLLAAALMSDSESLPMSVYQKRCVYLGIWLNCLRYFGYVVFAAMCLFLSDSTAVGIIALFVFSGLGQFVFRVIDYFTERALSDYTFDGLLDWGYTTVEAGGLAWQILPAAGMLLLALAVTVFFFQRKEFEF